VKFFLVFIGLIVILPLAAQEDSSLDWDISSVFSTPPPEASPLGETREERPPLLLLKQPGFTLNGSFEFISGAFPGWKEAPWFWDDEYTRETEKMGFSWGPAAWMRIKFDLDTQISEFLRVRSSLLITFPGSTIDLAEFFFDYNMFHKIFLKGGRFEQRWGISPNFAFSNLIARIPHEDVTGDPFIMRADIPVGIGGFQLLALTRTNLLQGNEIDRRDVAYGGKFNLALPVVDIDIGTFYQETMPLRGFLSIKTTLGKTEWYNEWVGVMDTNNLNNPNDVSGAFNVGFFRDFFENRLGVNGEVFFNTERNALWLRRETTVTDSVAFPFNEGLNLALNLLYRFRGKGSVRFFVQTLYAPEEQSAQVTPGFRISPWQHLELYFAVSMALGNKEGYYYQNPADPQNWGRPFTFTMLFTLKGSVKMGSNL